MIDKLEELIEVQKKAGRKGANIARKKRRNANRLSELLDLGLPVHSDLALLYEYYDGIDYPLNDFRDYYYFFANYSWPASYHLFAANKTCIRRKVFPLLDEIWFLTPDSGPELLITSISSSRYVITAAMSAASDIRIPAFDSIETMITTYLDAFLKGAWGIDDEGLTVIDHSKFSEVSQLHNKNCQYWKELSEKSVDFNLPELNDKGLHNIEGARTEPKSGARLLNESGYEIR